MVLTIHNARCGHRRVLDTALERGSVTRSKVASQKAYQIVPWCPELRTLLRIMNPRSTVQPDGGPPQRVQNQAKIGALSSVIRASPG